MIKCNLSFHWELVDCKLLHGRRLRAQVCGVANIHRVEICCIGSRGIAGEFMSISQVIFTPIVVFIEKIGPHPTSAAHVDCGDDAELEEGGSVQGDPALGFGMEEPRWDDRQSGGSGAGRE
jgi:hypothetical protein